MVEDYVRNAELAWVVDGDTVDLRVDLGFRIWMTMRVRVLGVNCPEMHGTSAVLGQKAKDFTTSWFAANPKFVIRTHLDKRDSFGRVLATIAIEDGESLGSELIKSGNAVVFRG